MTTSWAFNAKTAFGLKSNPSAIVSSELPSSVTEFEEKVEKYELSQYGEFIAVVFTSVVHIYELESWECVSVIETGKVSDCYFSPLNKFFVTWANMGPKVEFSLKLYEVATGEFIRGWKIPNKASWPMIQWTDDESYCTMMEQRGAINIYQSDYNERVHRYSKSGLLRYKIAPGDVFRIAVFVKGKGNYPSRSAIFNYPELETPLASISSFKADDATITWNSLGTAIILQTTRDLDESGKLYYGVSGLYLLRDDGFSSIVQAGTEPLPIHNVCWNPRGRQFAAIYGLMPDVTTSIFNLNCTRIKDITEETRNKLIWSSCGKILCVGGFESLTGSMSFFDVSNINQPKRIGDTTAFATGYHAFSPDSQYFIAATLSPRLRIDNGYKIFTYNGKLVSEESIDDLYKIDFIPARQDAPRIDFDIEKRVEEKKESVGIYRHPRFSQQNRALVENQEKRGQPDKTKKPIGYSEPKEQPNQKKKSTALFNRKRNLNRKLKDIENLVAKLESGEALENNQLNKIETKNQILSELEEIEKQIASSNSNF